MISTVPSRHDLAQRRGHLAPNATRRAPCSRAISRTALSVSHRDGLGVDVQAFETLPHHSTAHAPGPADVGQRSVAAVVKPPRVAPGAVQVCGEATCRSAATALPSFRRSLPSKVGNVLAPRIPPETRAKLDLLIGPYVASCGNRGRGGGPMRPWLWCCAALAACAPDAPTDPLADTDVGDTDTGTLRAFPSILVDERPAPVIAPADLRPRETLPAIVVLHGFAVTAALQEALFQLTPRVETSRFLLVLPEGVEDANGDQFWHAAEECCGVDRPDVDDVAYLSGLIAALREGWNVSTVAIVGHSNGGYMAYRMACDAPGVVDRIVVLAGGAPVDPPDCASGPPTGVLHIHGTADADVPYLAASEPVATPGAEAAVARQAARNGCEPTTTALGSADLVGRLDGDESDGVAYLGCDAPSALWTARDETHLFLTATDTLRDGIVAFALGGEPVFGE